MPRGSHANRGKAWEQIIEWHHKQVETKGLGLIFRTPPPMKLLQRLGGGQWRAVLTSEGPPDYLGLLKGPSGPVPVAIEAKDCAGDRWSLKELQPHQAAAFQAWADLGGLSVVLLRHKGVGWALPWERLGPIWSAWRAKQLTGTRAARGSASLGKGDLTVIGVKWDVGSGYYDAIISLTS